MKFTLFQLLLIAITFIAADAKDGNAQEILNQKISIEMKDVKLKKAISFLENSASVYFTYNPQKIKTGQKVSIAADNVTLETVLNQLFSPINIDYKVYNNGHIVLNKRNTIPNATLTGQISDTDGEPLIGVNIVIKGTSTGTISDVDGKYTLDLPNGNEILVFSYTGYLSKEVAVNGQTQLDVVLATNTEQLDQVVVTGIRASQQRAVAIKKLSSEFVDAITAESSGKLPDANVAEALQRVPGVAISRTRGQGDFISIRGLGPEFARGSLNGRSIVSASATRNTALSGGLNFGTGRATNFDVLPSDIIETIEVFKTSSAEHVEGGIGGSVNIKTVRPLDIGNKFGFNAKGVSFMERGLSPSLSAFGSLVNEANTIGAVITASYSERKIREDAARTFSYRASPTNHPLDGTEFEDVLFPFSSLPEVIEEDRKRITVSSTVQWKPNSTTNVLVDATYSRRDLDYLGRQGNIRVTPLPGTNPDLESIELDQNGSVTAWTGLAPIFLNTDNQQSTDDILSAGINISKELGKWTSVFDASYSRTTTDFLVERAALRVPGASPDFLIPYSTTIEDNILQLESTSAFNFSDPNNYVARGFGINENNITDEEFATRLDFSRELNSNFFSKFKVGARYRTRSRVNTINTFFDNLPVTTSGPIALNAGESGINVVNGDGEFLEREYSNGLYSEFLFVDNIQDWRQLHEDAGGVFEVINDPNESYNVTENTLAAYAQLDFNGKIGDFPLTGNIGFRVVNTDITVDGQAQEIGLTPLDPNDPDPNTAQVTRFLGTANPFTNEGGYFNFLPSVNLKVQATDNIFFRAAFSQTITRPQFVNLGGFDFNPTNNVVNSAGNPNLDPYQSNNYDVGIEWYTGGTGAIGITFFYKDLSSFITPVNIPNFEALGIVWDFYNTFENQGEGSIAGTEISFQQPLKFLPGALNGLGVIANFTFANGQQSLTNGTPVSFPGVSDFSFNSALYYDNGGKIQGRLAYTFRDDFLILTNDVFGQEQYNNQYGQLDASLSYKVFDNITFYVEATNLTNERNILYASNPSSPAFNLERPTSYEITGPRFAFGVRGSF